MGEIFKRAVPDTPLEWTGERLTTATAGQVEIEHLHRYFLARALCRDRDVLDVASGEGYGSALLAQTARSVTGVEVSADAVAHSVAAYHQPNLRFLEGDARRLPLGDASVDIVVSFETVEHLYEHDQFVAEVRRVLRPGGRFIVSSPERDIYSPSGSDANPYHVRELTRAEFSALLSGSFAHVHLLGQRPVIGSVLVSDGPSATQPLTFEKRGPSHFEASTGLPRPVYLVAVASDEPVTDVANSLYIETAEVGPALVAVNATESVMAELTALRARVSGAEQAAGEARARAEIAVAEARAQTEAARLEVQAASEARVQAEMREAEARAQAEAVRLEIQTVRAEASAASSQRDIARLAARRAAASAQGQWRNPKAEGNGTASASNGAASHENSAPAEGSGLAAEAGGPPAEASEQTAEWRSPGLARLLHQPWILRASRLIPESGRRLVRDRLLRSGHH